MSDTALQQPQPHQPYDEENDPFRYGWRHVKEIGPDGTETINTIPLTLEDLLFPEEYDYTLNSQMHTRDFCYVEETLRGWYEDKKGVVMLGDHRIDWGVEGIRPMGPDIVVLFDAHPEVDEATYKIARDGGRPVFVMEITSPSTRNLDFNRKPALLYAAGVERYVIVDRGPSGKGMPELIAFERGEEDWLELPLDEDGRVAIAPGEPTIGIQGDRAWLYHPHTSERFAESGELWRKAQELTAAWEEAEEKAKEAEAKAKRETRRRTDAETKARDAETKARDAVAKVSIAESKAALEAKQRHDAETKARDAETKARDAETKARDAESKAALEAKHRADAETKVLEAEARIAELLLRLGSNQSKESSP